MLDLHQGCVSLTKGNWRALGPIALAFLLLLLAVASLGTAFCTALFYLSPSVQEIFSKHRLYVGRVSHTRYKGGAQHHLSYPVCFALLDLRHIAHASSWLWPLFTVGLPRISFSSFDEKNHMKDHPPLSAPPSYVSPFSPSSASLPSSPAPPPSMVQRLRAFCLRQSEGGLDIGEEEEGGCQVLLLTNLTYFNYCFNPLSVYYLLEKQTGKEQKGEKKEEKEEEKQAGGRIRGVVAEVSNTPWLEMHSYVLHEASLQCTSVTRKASASTAGERFIAVWNKAFHVSPFMAMDFAYHFSFSPPGPTLSVTSHMTKRDKPEEVFFTASFHTSSLPFTPCTLLYLLLCFPLYTYSVQLLIHIEALKLLLKRVALHPHPQDKDVDFGFGITGERLGKVLGLLAYPLLKVYGVIGGAMATERDREGKEKKEK